MQAAELARQLHAKPNAPGAWMAKCPAHDDKTASLSIATGEDGRLLLHCFAGCQFDQIMRAAGVEPEPPKANGKDHGVKPRIVSTYDYRDPHGEVVFQVVRMAPKDFRQRRPDGSGGWLWNMQGVELLPYRLPDVLNASEIFVCEGEKDCDRLGKLGIVATTNPAGAGKWPKVFAGWFDGRHVTIIPDADQPGLKHARDVAAKLRATAGSIKILELPGLPDKGDVSDWLDAGGTTDQLRDLAAAAPYWEGETAADDEERTTEPGEAKVEPEPPFRYIDNDDLAADLPLREFLVERWIPVGCVTSLYGSGGTGKSFLAIMLAMCVAAERAWLGFTCKQASVLAVMCEDDEAEIKRRRNKIARSLGISSEDVAGRLWITSRLGLANHLMEFPNGVATRTPLFDRIIAEAKQVVAGLVILDNAAQLYGGNENDRAQVTAFLNAVAGIANEIGGSVVLLGHPPKVAGVEFSGSTAWDAVVRSRIWFKRVEDDEAAVPGAPERYTLELVKSNYEKRFGIVLQENSHGIVEYAGELVKAKKEKRSAADEHAQVLRDLFSITRTAITDDEIVEEKIRRGLCKPTEKGSSDRRAQTQAVRKYMYVKRLEIEEREAGSYVPKPQLPRP